MKNSIYTNNKNIKANNVLGLSGTKAHTFFLEEKNYCNFDLPLYFTFNKLLQNISHLITNQKNNPCNINKAKKHEKVNHTILHNKNGKFAWRNFELINPILYVDLIDLITKDENWKIICQRFDEFRANPNIECMSIPIVQSGKKSAKSAQVSKWWQDVEQNSIKQSLNFEYLFKTDITDCYPSIYTHSIAWALHGREKIKNRIFEKNSNKSQDKLIGDEVDKRLSGMSYGQTNGIPQGSTLTDFIAEIVLGYADLLLTEKIGNRVEKYKIIRYRDDYRIYVNSTSEGDLIVKCLCEVLIDLGLKLNPSKTMFTNEIVKYSLKDDKRYYIGKTINEKNDPQKSLLLVHELALLYPASGSLKRALDEYLKMISSKKRFQNVEVLISIITDIAINNPNVYPIATAVLSKYISCISSKNEKMTILNNILDKFNKIPNTGHLDIWLQRVTYKLGKDFKYGERLCDLVYGKNKLEIWNFKWADPDFVKKIEVDTIVDRKILESMPEIIKKNEVELFIEYE